MIADILFYLATETMTPIKGMKKIELLGMRFGHLTVIADTRPKCLCRCVCGNEKLITRNKLPNGRQKSCGCQHGAATRARKRRNLLGQKFYRLTCVDNGVDTANRRWECECGTFISANANDVKGGNTQSCGCQKREQISITGSRTSKKNSKAASQKRWSMVLNGKKIQFRSGFEYIYASYLVGQGIPFLFEPKTFVLTKEVRYTPDFYLPITDEWVEVKGVLTDRAAAKHDMFASATGHKLLLVKEPDIKALLRKGLSLWKFYETYRSGATPEPFLAQPPLPSRPLVQAA